MKRLCLMIFVLGVVLMAMGVESLYAVVYQNAKCVAILAPGQCKSSGSSYCQAEADDGTCDAGTCASCDSSTGIPSKSCVFWEHCTCVADTSSCVNCGGSDRLVGECGEARGICQCTNQQVDGTCPSQLYCWCPG